VSKVTGLSREYLNNMLVSDDQLPVSRAAALRFAARHNELKRENDAKSRKRADRVCSAQVSAGQPARRTIVNNSSSNARLPKSEAQTVQFCPLPNNGCKWGNWTFNKPTLSLIFRNPKTGWFYDVDLERMTSSARMLDVICQLSDKHAGRVSPSDIGDLIEALNALLRPQANLCSWGKDKQFNPTQYLSRKRVQ
jgi:hypothetical protein